jgi:hypothetical protein
MAALSALQNDESIAASVRRDFVFHYRQSARNRNMLIERTIPPPRGPGPSPLRSLIIKAQTERYIWQKYWSLLWWSDTMEREWQIMCADPRFWVKAEAEWAHYFKQRFRRKNHFAGRRLMLQRSESKPIPTMKSRTRKLLAANLNDAFTASRDHGTVNN